MKTILTERYTSPCGTLILGSYGDRLCLCDWEDGHRHSRTMKRVAGALHATYAGGHSSIITEAMRQLDEYFAGCRKEFSLPLLPAGTAFQTAAWDELLRIPFGTTVSYGEQARLMGRPDAVRAVAGANGANALSIVIPCHRVVGANGCLTGYAGGIDAKRFLLKLEAEAR